jgi:hypothetical protein
MYLKDNVTPACIKHAQKKYIHNFYTAYPAKLKNKLQTTVPYK